MAHLTTILAQTGSTVPMAATASGSGAAPSAAAAVVFFAVCAVLVVGGLMIFLTARARARDGAADQGR